MLRYHVKDWYISMNSLSHASGVNKNTINSWACGRTSPTLQALLDVRRGFEILGIEDLSLDYMVGLSDKMTITERRKEK